MKRVLLLFCLLAFTTSSFATHMMGGEVTYTHITGNTYEIRFEVYRDCQQSNTAWMPNLLSYQIYNSGTLSSTNRSAPRTNLYYLTSNIPACITQPYCTEVGIFKDIVNFDLLPFNIQNSTTGFFIRYYCQNCRNNNITNVQQDGIIFQARMPPLNIKNNSPVFLSEPVPYLCVGRPTLFNQNGFDLEGDSLVFSLVTPKASGIPPNYSSVPYRFGYSLNFPFGTASPAISIDPVTGEVTAQSNAQGIYVIAIQVDEFRKDPVTSVVTYLGRTVRELQFIVRNCGINPPPTLDPDPVGLSKYVNVGDTLCFTVSGSDALNTAPSAQPYDTVYLKATGSIFNSLYGVQPPYATFPDTSAYRFIDQEFCWTPACHHITYTSPHIVTVSLEDEGCNLVQRTYSIFVNPTTIIQRPPASCVNVLSDTVISLQFAIDTPHTAFQTLYIYRQEGNGGYQLLDSIFDPGLTFFHDSTVSNALSSAYSYFIRAKNVCGVIGLASDTLATMHLSATYIDDKHVRFDWNHLRTEPTLYILEADTGQGYFPVGSTYNNFFNYINCDIKGDFRIKAFHDSCFSYTTKPIFIELLDTIAPVTPAIINATVTNGQMELTLEKSSSYDIKEYYLYRKDAGTYAIIDTILPWQPQFQVYNDATALTSQVQYCYKLAAIDSCGNVTESLEICPALLLSTPGQLRVFLNWESFSGYAVGSVFLQKRVNNVWVDLDTLLPSVSNYIDSVDIHCNFLYEYRLATREINGNRTSYSNITQSIPYDSIAPQIPNVIRSTVNDNHTITLSWDTVPDFDVNRYIIYVAVNNGAFVSLDTVNQQPFAVNTFTHTGIDPTSNTYSYQIKAIDSCSENVSELSEIHRTVEVRAIPANFAAYLNWHPYIGFNIEKYYIERLDGATWQVIDSVNGTDTSFIDTLLGCNVNYVYRIIASEGTGLRTSQSNTVHVVPFDTIAPPQVNILNATVINHSTINLTFEPVADADVNRYEIHVKTNNGNFALLQTIYYPTGTYTFSHTGINAGIDTFCYMVFAVDSCGNNISHNSETHCAIQLTGFEKNLANQLNWSAHAGFVVDEYQVERLDNGNWTQVIALPSTQLSYIDSALPCYVTQFYRILAIEQGGELQISVSDTIALTPYDTVAPSPPSINNVTLINNSTIDISWNHSDSTDVDRYIVYRKPASGNWVALDTLGYVNFYQDQFPVPINTSYCYAIAAIDSCADNVSELSPTHCNIFLQADTISCEQDIHLNWNLYSGFTPSAYNIYRAENGGTELLYTTLSSTATYFKDSNVAFPNTYCYRIEAVGTGIESFSNTACNEPFTPAIPQAINVTTEFTSQTTGEIKVKWENQAGKKFIHFQRLYHSQDGVNFTLIDDNIPLSRDSFVHSGINTESVVNSYYVTNVDSCGNESDIYNIHSSIDFDFQIGQLLHTLNWTHYQGWPVEKYYIQERLGNVYVNIDSVPGTESSWVKYPAPCNFEIVYRVMAINSNGDFSISDTVANQAIDTIPSNPIDFNNATVLNNSQIQLDFTGADSLDLYIYDIRRSVNGNPFTTAGTVPFTTPSDAHLWVDNFSASSGQICYTITTLDSCLNATPSDTFCVVYLSGEALNLADSVNFTDFIGYNIDYFLVRESMYGSDTILVRNFAGDFIDEPLPCNMPFTYHIYGEEIGGTRITRSNSIVLIPFDTIAPDAPEIRYASVINNTTIELVWDSSLLATDVAMYELWVSENGGPFTVVDTLYHDYQTNPFVFQHTGLDAVQNNYCYYVKAIDSCAYNTSLPGEIHCVVKIEGAAGNLENTLQWSAYEDFQVQEYFIFREEGNGWNKIDSLSGTTYTDTLVACNVDYTYQILTVSSNGDSSYSNTIILTPFDTLPPPAPVIHYASVQTDRSIRLAWDWDPAKDVKYFEVYRSTDGSIFDLVDTVEYDSIYIDLNVDAQLNHYWYYLIAIDSCSNVNRSLPSDTSRTMLVGLSTYGCTPVVYLEWTPYFAFPEGQHQYMVWRTDDTENYTLIETLDGNTTTFNDSTVTAGIPYCYRISSVDSVSVLASFSDSFCIIPEVYPLPPLANLVYTTVLETSTLNGEVFLEWEEADVADTVTIGYRIFHSTDNATFTQIYKETDRQVTTFNHPGIDTEKGLNHYRIAKYNHCGAIGDSSTLHRPVQLEVNNHNLETEIFWTPYLGFEVDEYVLMKSINGSTYYQLAQLPGTDTFFIDSDIRCDQEYSYQVFANNNTANLSSASDTFSLIGFDTIPPREADIFFATVATTHQTAGEIILQFQGADEPNRKGYVVYRSGDGTNFTAVDTIFNTSTAPIVYNNLNINTTQGAYYYYITSFDSCGNQAMPLDTHRTIFLQATATSQANLLNWTHYEGFGNWEYTVERRTASTSWTALSNINRTITNYNDSATRCDTLYTYRIIATETGTGYQSISNLASVTAFETDSPDVPVIRYVSVTATGTANGEVMVAWTPSQAPDVEGYYIEKRAVGALNWTLAATNVKGNSYTDFGLNTLERSYEYRIYAMDSCGNPSLLSPVHQTINLRVDEGNEQLMLSWNHYEGWPIEEYEIYKDGILYEKLPPTETSFTDTNVICIYTYTYAVRAINSVEAAISSYSNTDDGMPYDTKAPRPVYLRSASVTTANNEVKLSWGRSNNFDARNYNVYRRIPGERRYSLIHSTQSVEDTSFVDPIEINGQSICYRITVVDYCDNESEDSNDGCLIILSGEDGPQHNNISWNRYQQWTGGVGTYRIYRSDDGEAWMEIGQVDGNRDSYSDKQLAEHVKDYCYQVEAVDQQGSDYTSFSTTICLMQEPIVYIPNAFSPEVTIDINDFFGPKGMYIASFNLAIYNRWGQRIYESNNIHWNGNDNSGNTVQTGAYIYKITVISYNGNVYHYTGGVTVVR